MYTKYVSNTHNMINNLTNCKNVIYGFIETVQYTYIKQILLHIQRVINKILHIYLHDFNETPIKYYHKILIYHQ